nr:DNA packaging tegument protein UL17 [Mastomys natalensis cytomegalovirus 3]WEG69919.1 DNA packaging tegument protein UL17 [Mastomys natalensis cytomegalovirus 3]WEG70059.1 DNA packaging tegument protein UL17 [Mastomys natalensis cytomegalovirus 3]WEG70199.1 DNA packaging tegument protein UL17 [Mastomys natalensis cytomegalovirus 3]WEG70339.1 DNA packaging tegument protein UL17 [Mastomys natalensis cytomegalovirus 3]
METHLRFEPDVSKDESRMCPVHILFTQDTLTYKEFKSLRCISFKIISKHDARWNNVSYFQKLDREFLIKSLFHERCGHFSADPGSSVPIIYGGDERCTHGIVFSIRLDLRDNEWWRHVVRFRMTMEDDEVINMDCTFVRLMREGLRFFGEVKRAQPRSVGRRDVTKTVDADITEYGNVDTELDGEIPKDLIPPEGPGFFDLGESRKMSGDMEDRLSKFTIKRVSATDFGPLEPPSKIRGRETKVRRGEFFKDGDTVVVAEPVRSRSDRWFGGDNVVRVCRAQEVAGVRQLVLIWYSESYGTNIEVDTVNMNDGEAAVTSFEYTRRWERTVTRIYSRIAKQLVETVSRSGGLSQNFYVNLYSGISGVSLVELLRLSRDAWLVNSDGTGCIIKALSSDLHQRRRSDANNRGCRTGWADVIRISQGRVASGIPIKLMRVGGEGLWRSYFDTDKLTDWELDPEVCVLYAFEDRSLCWAIPGGFCAVFDLNIEDADAKIIREKFEEC